MIFVIQPAFNTNFNNNISCSIKAVKVHVTFITFNDYLHSFMAIIFNSNYNEFHPTYFS